jgi:hypothetical protein
LTIKAPVMNASNEPALANFTKHSEGVWSGSGFRITFDSAKGLLQLENTELVLLGEMRYGELEGADMALVLQRSDSETYIRVGQASFHFKGDIRERPWISWSPGMEIVVIK